jgi:hypothetical protein
MAKQENATFNPGRGFLELDGFRIALYRGVDGVMVVEVDTAHGSEQDHHESTAPRLRLWVNEDCQEIAPNGDWGPPSWPLEQEAG